MKFYNILRRNLLHSVKRERERERERESKNQQDATIRCLLSTSVSTCFGHHYARLQENKDRVTTFGVPLCNKRENVDISHDVFFLWGSV